MCGIVGLIDINENLLNNTHQAKNMLSALSHRGPDDEGYFVQKRNGEFYRCTGDDTSAAIIERTEAFCNITSFDNHDDISLVLGHRRLSIIDKSESGHQPMLSADNRYVIVYNGEIYNYLELRNILIEKGYTFQTKTDTEVVLNSFIEWKEDCLSRFNGDWALIIFDRLEKSLFIARDRFGIKPLYYYHDENIIILSSEIKGIISHDFLNHQPNVDIVKTYLEEGANEWSSSCCFKDIHRFPIASYVYLKLSGPNASDLNFEKFYTPPINVKSEKFSLSRLDAIADEYYHLLKDAVSIRLQSDVPLGFSLSGGLDSSAIVYLADELNKERELDAPTKTFSLVHHIPETSAFDESYYIDLLVSALDLEAYKAAPVLSDLKGRIYDAQWAFENPPDGLAIVGSLAVDIANRAGFVVTLDGQGADETQAGYNLYLINLLKEFDLRELLSSVPQTLKNYPLSKSKIIKLYIFSAILKIFGSASKYLFRGKTYNQLMSRASRSLNEELLLSVNHGLVNLLHYSDKRFMAQGIESRMPFMDHRIVEFSLSVPSCYKFHNGYTKYFARHAFSGKLPDQIVWRKDKLGFPSPSEFWMDGYLAEWAREKLRSSKLLATIDTVNINSSLTHEALLRMLNVSVMEELFFTGK